MNLAQGGMDKKEGQKQEEKKTKRQEQWNHFKEVSPGVTGPGEHLSSQQSRALHCSTE